MRITYFILALLTLTAVFAAGSGGGGGGGSTGGSGGGVKTCESYDTLEDRIKCRLTRDDEMETVEESCRGLKNWQQCENLYRVADECYDTTGVNKDRCFKAAAGVQGKSIHAETNKQAIQFYAVLLLYDIQERTEELYEAQEITVEQTATCIAAVIDAKQVILRPASHAIIKNRVAEVKVQCAFLS
jgi:hypothetical protein